MTKGRISTEEFYAMKQKLDTLINVYEALSKVEDAFDINTIAKEYLTKAFSETHKIGDPNVFGYAILLMATDIGCYRNNGISPVLTDISYKSNEEIEALVKENTELKKKVESFSGKGGYIETVEKRIHEVMAENKRLKVKLETAGINYPEECDGGKILNRCDTVDGCVKLEQVIRL